MDFVFDMEINKFDSQCRSLWRAYEMTEIRHTDMIDRANIKLMMESGTYEDAMFLYEEANAETNKNKDGIFTRLINAIKSFFSKLKNFLFGGDTQEKIDGIDPNKQYPSDISEENAKGHHNAIQTFISDFKKFFSSGGDEVPESLKKAKNVAVGTVVAGGGAYLGGSLLKSTLNYTQGDSKALDSVFNWAQNQIDKMTDTSDDGKLNIKKSALELLQEVVSREATWANKLIGTITSKVEGSLEKHNTKSADKIKNSQEYKDLIEKKEKGTLTTSEKEKLEKLGEKISNKETKAAKHGENKEKAEVLKELGSLSSNIDKVEAEIIKINKELSKGKINKDDATKRRDEQQKIFNDYKKTFEDHEDDERITSADKSNIQKSIKNYNEAINKLNTEISGNKNSASKDNNSSGDSNKNSSSKDNNSSDTSNEENSDEEESDNEDDDNIKSKIKGITAKKFTGNDDDQVNCYRMKKGKLYNPNTGGRKMEASKAKKTLKNVTYGNGPKGDAFYYEEADYDWFDIDTNDNAIYEAYSGALDDELLELFSEL